MLNLNADDESVTCIPQVALRFIQTELGLVSVQCLYNVGDHDGVGANQLRHESHHEKTCFLHICENKDADQLCGDRFCFHYIDITIPLLPKSEISSF